MKPVSQPIRSVGPEYDQLALMRELEHLHKTINERFDPFVEVETVSGAKTLVSTDSGKFLLVDTVAARAITLPTPSVGMNFRIKDKTGNAGTNNITLVRQGSEKIAGTAANYTISTNNQAIFLVSDGTDWFLF